MPNRRISIIVVDDNDMTRTLLRGILRGETYNVIGEARNGVLAVEMTNRLKPDIVCLDVIMPEKDGVAALSEIKLARPATEVVMITGNADSKTVQASIQNGASGFIIKPFNSARVLDVMNKIAARIRQRPV